MAIYSSSEVELYCGTVGRILYIHPYYAQLTQQMNLANIPNAVDWVLEQQTMGLGLLKQNTSSLGIRKYAMLSHLEL